MLGVFDSGFGGLNVLRAIRARLPDAGIMYLGDGARTPYGNHSRKIVTQYTRECCQFLFDRGCTLIVLACNTASAETLRELQQRWLPTLRSTPRNILGVIRPLAEEAVLHTHNNTIGVVGTRSTVESGAYVEELKKLKPGILVVQQACPLLVPLIEEGWTSKPETRRILRAYLRPLKSRNPDVLILGCTHYEALYPLFAREMGRRCAVLRSPAIIACKLAEYLVRHPEYEIPLTGETRFLTTGDPKRFVEAGSRFYGGRIREAEHVSLDRDVFPCQPQMLMVRSTPDAQARRKETHYRETSDSRWGYGIPACSGRHPHDGNQSSRETSPGTPERRVSAPGTPWQGGAPSQDPQLPQNAPAEGI